MRNVVQVVIHDMVSLSFVPLFIFGEVFRDKIL